MEKSSARVEASTIIWEWLFSFSWRPRQDDMSEYMVLVSWLTSYQFNIKGSAPAAGDLLQKASEPIQTSGRETF
jgi:hypothetical protein